MPLIFDGTGWTNDFNSPPNEWDANRAPYEPFDGSSLPALGGYRFDDQQSGLGQTRVVWTTSAVNGVQNFQHELRGAGGFSARLLIEEITWDGAPGSTAAYTVVRTLLDETLTRPGDPVDSVTYTTHAVTTNGPQILRIQADTNGSQYVSSSTGNNTIVTLLAEPGPTTPEELFQATYANASAKPPRVMALTQPLATQRAIDTEVSSLLINPKEFEVTAPLEVDELQYLQFGQPFFVQDDQPGLRDGNILLLQEFDMPDMDPGVPITFKFWGAS